MNMVITLLRFLLITIYAALIGLVDSLLLLDHVTRLIVMGSQYTLLALKIAGNILKWWASMTQIYCQESQELFIKKQYPYDKPWYMPLMLMSQKPFLLTLTFLSTFIEAQTTLIVMVNSQWTVSLLRTFLTIIANSFFDVPARRPAVKYFTTKYF